MLIKRGKQRFRGGEMQGDKPNWGPLLELAPEEIDDFMWMFEVELEDGAMVQAYKHWWTRGYVHLDYAGRAFVFDEDDLYEEVDSGELLAAVLRGRSGRGSRAAILREEWVDTAKLEWAPSATRHGVAATEIAFLIGGAGLCFEAGQRDELHPRLFFFGKDRAGVELEIAAVELRDGRLRVVHAMPLRERFRIDYVEAVGWRK